MDTGEASGFGGGLRGVNEAAIEESGLLGTRRGCININRYEIIFLCVGILAAITTDSLTIVRLVEIINDTRNADFAYAILLLVNSVFLLLFLITGILYQRITDIVVFFITAVMLTIYVIVHFIARMKTIDRHDTYAKILLTRLIITIIFNICFVPLAILVIQDYRRDEFSKRLFGAFPAERRPLKIYNIFDCLIRINTMLSISIFILNLYNFNSFEWLDRIFLAIGIPLTFLWLAIGSAMVRLENHILVGIFYLISLFQPGFLCYCIYNAVINTSTYVTSATIITTTFTVPTTMTTNSSVIPTTLFTSSMFPMNTTAIPKNLVSVPDALYVCIGTNFLSHILSLIFAFLCIHNFGKGLKERVFNNRIDKWFQRH
ncbi:unnamed protein product [Adineta steineri]|uniref:DUF7789 domain-containing protein n=1 Tax=Adineta steineri TaxID=433720 RepID=A0A814I897_9BILA|nr:unnamed protein product [Adineta steineri]CAF1465962.1 unnamed protein product [Adineta steineri]